MSGPSIEELFDEHRLPSGANLLLFILYSPIGLVLALLRVFIGLHTFIIALWLPKTTRLRTFVLRCMCAVLGLCVKETGSANRDPSVKMIVANYCSALDHLIIELVLPNIVPSVWDLPSLLMWILGYKDMGAKKGRATLIENAKLHCASSSIPLLSFPEGASTNGKKGLLKFSVWPFSLDHPVQPVILHLYRPPFARVAPSVLGGRWWLDIFWFLFVPFTRFTLTVLPTLAQKDEESYDEFARRAQEDMAAALSIAVTPHTSADKVEYAKRKLIDNMVQAGSQNRASGRDDTNQEPDPLVVMSRQVKEVLPHVPISVISEDMALTKDVDLTISRILEGQVEFTPEEPGVEASPANPISELLRSPSDQPQQPLIKSEIVFSKDSKKRQNLLDERKKALLEIAKRKYVEHH